MSEYADAVDRRDEAKSSKRKRFPAQESSLVEAETKRIRE